MVNPALAGVPPFIALW